MKPQRAVKEVLSLMGGMFITVFRVLQNLAALNTHRQLLYLTVWETQLQRLPTHQSTTFCSPFSYFHHEGLNTAMRQVLSRVITVGNELSVNNLTVTILL